MAKAVETPKIGSRQMLVEALRQASELEHGLCLLYLFAAFSLRKTLDDFATTGGDETERRIVMQRNQRWEATVLEVARQEMEHLGIVVNMLNALGAEPYLWRPNFPLPASAFPLDEPFSLDRFDAATLRRFMEFERPAYFTRDLRLAGAGMTCSGEGAEDTPVAQGPRASGGDGLAFANVQELYEEILAAFQTLPARELFRGDTSRQVNVADLALGFNVTMEPVFDRASAATAIDLVLEQGEGIGDEPLSPDSHFLRFTRIRAALRETRASFPDVDPAFDVARNPLLEPPRHPEIEHHVVENHFTRRVMRLFNHGYFVMLVMLRRFFTTFQGFPGNFQAVGAVEPISGMDRKRQNSALLENAYFPFMTMFVRPLGEVLVHLPVDDEGGLRAGASFELPADLDNVPDWDELEPYDEALGKLERESAEAACDAPDSVRPRLEFLHENLHRMRRNFRRVWKHGN